MKRPGCIFSMMVALVALNARAEGWYLGASAGVMSNDVAGYDDATNAGVLIGYDVFTMNIFALSLEGEATTTVADGDVEFRGASGDWDIDTQAAYAAARLGDRFFIKVRYGAIRRDVSVDIAGASVSDSDTGFSWAGALGWMFNKHWGVQVDGTTVDGDLTYWNAGVRYQFQ